MALWHRIKPSKFHSIAAHHFLGWRPSIIVRSFAAPVQVKPKPSADDLGGPRMNTAITAPVVRLVTDEGHGIVPLREALHRAKRLNLDLVEVQRTSNPPVCKIVDYHKEKFKQEIKEKERVKTKSAVTLRNGENKEIRFKAKTEPKDLKMKAETITRLMERGYRVKCTAISTGKENENLGGLLSHLLSLIEDVCLVESGPHLDTSKAYVIVRHVKFATKKSGKKVSKVVDTVNRGVYSSIASTSAATSSSQDEAPLKEGEEWESVASCSESENDLFTDEIGTNSEQLSDTSSTNVKEASSSIPPEEVGWSGFNVADDLGFSGSLKSVIPQVTSEFLKRSKQHSNESISAASVDKGPDMNSRNRNSKPGLVSLKEILESSEGKSDRRISNSSTSLQSDLSVAESNRYGRQGQVKASFNPIRSAQGSNANSESKVSWNQGRMQQQLHMKESAGVQVGSNSEHSHMGTSNSPSPRLGIFKASKLAGATEQRNDRFPSNSSPQRPTFGVFSAQKAGADSSDETCLADSSSGNPSGSTTPKTSFGISSTSKTSSFGEERKQVEETTIAKHGNPVLDLPSYGIFSANKPAASDEQRNLNDAAVDKAINPTSPTPRYGIFSTSQTATLKDGRN